MFAIILNGAWPGNKSPYGHVDILTIMKGPHHLESFAYSDHEIVVGLGFVTLNQFKRWSSDPKEF